MAVHSTSLKEELLNSEKGKSKPKEAKPADSKGSKKK